MLFLILAVLIIVLGFALIHTMDQRRWHRYKFERDVFFKKNPYILQCNEQFLVALNITNSMQKKLINELMLKADQCQLYKEVILQRDGEQHQHNSVKATMSDLNLSHLEPNYAGKFSKSLARTDFHIGRPVKVLATISVLVLQDQVVGLQIHLDLPLDPTQANQFLMTKAAAKTRAD